MEGDAARVITEPLMRNSREIFFFSIIFSLSPLTPLYRCLHLAGKQWRQWERVLSRFIVHCFVRGKVNLPASGHELRFTRIRRVKFGDKARD